MCLFIWVDATYQLSDIAERSRYFHGVGQFLRVVLRP